jgi:hypothetical protein
MLKKTLIWFFFFSLSLANAVHAQNWSYAGTFSYLSDETDKENPIKYFSYYNSIQYAFDSTFLFFSIPFIYQDLQTINQNIPGTVLQPSRYEFELGDIYFSISKDIISEEMDKSPFSLQFSFGINVPTGDEVKGQSTGEIDYDFGLFISEKISVDWLISLSAIYRLSGDSREFDFSDIVSYQLELNKFFNEEDIILSLYFNRLDYVSNLDDLSFVGVMILKQFEKHSFHLGLSSDINESTSITSIYFGFGLPL